ncbi:MAG: hypothetical protein WBG32_02970 [Nodosilinea sp.]
MALDIVLYIATSLDGFIATPEGGIDWLAAIEIPEEDYGYEAFYSSIDAIVMGRRTYDQVLSFGDWPYPGKPSYIMTHQPLSPLPLTCPLSALPPSLPQNWRPPYKPKATDACGWSAGRRWRPPFAPKA